MATDRRTEPPTARRLRRARREGDHPLSNELVSLAGLALAALVLPYTLRSLARQTHELLELALRANAEPSVAGLVQRVIGLVAPVVGVAALAGLAAGLWQTGGAFSLVPLRWDWQRLSPWGRKRQSFGQRLWPLLRSVAAAALLTGFAWRLFASEAPALGASVGSAAASLMLSASLCERLLHGALVIMLGTAAADAVFVRLAWYGRQRMTREEVRREQRESEGDPGSSEARRRAHRELNENAALNRISDATLVVLGRPRLATALRYDPARDAAPVVLLQADGALANALEALATRQAVPVFEDLALATELARLPAGAPIPPALFVSVASAIREPAGTRGQPYTG